MKITHFDANYPWNLGNTTLSQGGGVPADTGNSGSGGGGGGGAPSGPASGDLGGSFPGPTVVGIQGTPVDALPAIATEYLNGDGHWTTPAGGGGGYVVNVMDYGAVEDFSTDNATAFAAAVAAMVDGCTLVFPSITGLGYKTSAGITITKKGCLITGTGSEYGTQVHITASNTTFFTSAPSWDGTRDQTNLIRCLLITGPGSASSGRGVYASSDVHLENVGIAGFYDGLYWDQTTYYSRAVGCFITNCTHTAIAAYGTNNITIDKCRITGDWGSGSGLIGALAFGVVIQGSRSNRITNCSIEYFTHDGIWLDGNSPTNADTSSTVIIGNWFESEQSSTGFAHVRVGNGHTTRATVIEGNWMEGGNTSGFWAIDGQGTEVTITGNAIYNHDKAIRGTGAAANWLLVNNIQDTGAQTMSLPATNYTLDPSSPPLSGSAGGDLSGSWGSTTVAKINGIAVSGTPAVGYVPTATSSSAATWQAQAGGSGAHYLVIASSHSTPLVFGDLVQATGGSDLIYTS